MEHHSVIVKSVDKLTHDVLKIATTKPEGYSFIPGQATEIAIDKPGWEEARRPFTFTNLPGDDHLEFVIKTYPEKKGVTNELLNLKANDQLLIHDVFGAITYDGQGSFIAGGAGITPFISIFRYLQSKHEVNGNRLIFANKTRSDIILESWFKNLLGSSFVNILSEEEAEGYHYGFINRELITDNIVNKDQRFYVCGPPPMMDAVMKQLEDLDINKNAIVLEV